MRRAQILLFVLFIAIGGVVLWKVTRNPEPIYQGKPLGVWLGELAATYGNPTAPTDYRNALHQIGSEAVPLIFRKLEQNDSPWRNKYRDIYPHFPGFLQKCLPKSKPIVFDANCAGAALAFCGTKAIRLVINGLNDANPAVREAAWEAVQGTVGLSLSIPTNEIISLCLPALGDNDALVSMLSAMCLGRMGAAASNAVPALLPLLSGTEVGRGQPMHLPVRAFAARTLGLIGPAASNAVPALTALTASGDSLSRVSAAFALWQITSNETVTLPVLISELPKFNKPEAIGDLAAMGPRAKAAFPILLRELPRAVDAVHARAITNALKAIDPEAAAKAGIK